jgi:hypothetical protein
MRERWPLIIFAAVMAAVPSIPGMPPFWIVLLDNIGLSALVAMGLVLLTGVGGLTSFGQAIICRSAPWPGGSGCSTCSASSHFSAAMTASPAFRRCRSAR